MKFKLLLTVLAVTCMLSANSQKLFIGEVTNGIKIGPLAGNKNLILGAKNILSEAIQDKELTVVGSKESADLILDIEVIYFDLMQTNAGVSVFHKNSNETIIRIKGVLYKGGKKVKDYIATGKSTEISTSTMIVDEGGGFNQANARSAIKKTIINLIENLL